MASLSKGTESWVLMALIYKDLDDYDFTNALVLCERLFAIDKDCEDFCLLYAKCHYLMKDYHAASDLLKKTTTIPCLYLYARTCLELGHLKPNDAEKLPYWRLGIKSLQQALSEYEKLGLGQNWANDLVCASTRSHMPSEASIHKLLGEFYHQMDNMNESAKHLVQCLTKNRFKFSAYTQLCDIAPDIDQPDTNLLPRNIFNEFKPETTLLNRSLNIDHLPLAPSKIPPSSKYTTLKIDDQQQQQKSSTAPQQDQPHNSIYLMPLIRSSHHSIPLPQLRSIVADYIYKESELDFTMNDAPERSTIEKDKDKLVEFMADDIQKQKEKDTQKSKHGLHKKPMTTKMDYEYTTDNIHDDKVDCDDEYVEIGLTSPPRIDSPSASDVPQEDKVTASTTKTKTQFIKNSSKKMTDNVSQPSTLCIDNYFIPWMSTPLIVEHESPVLPPRPRKKRLYPGKTTTTTTTTTGTSTSTSKAAKEATDQTVIDAMNEIVRLLSILGTAYYCKSHHYCPRTVKTLQKLDDSQYDTPSVLCLMGQAYYDVGLYEYARVFYQRSFSIAPWYCEGTALYSTCLWYLEKQNELHLLFNASKDNQSHLYGSYIAAGNWAKCANRGNEAIQWFQKAVDLDPSQSYGHALLGYEDLEKNDYLGAREHFIRCMNTNKQSYLGWYGSAKAYQSMNCYPQAKQYVTEAIRLHPRQPLLLGTMAEILWALKDYKQALQFVEKSLTFSDNTMMQELKSKIKHKLELQQDDDTSPL